MSEIKRRDPRREWILRNRLHPRHEALLGENAAVVIGPSGLKRINPHKVAFIGPNGLKRIDRSGATGGASTSRQTQETQAQLPLHQVSEPQQLIVVVPDLAGGELSAHDRDVLGMAQQLAAEREACAVLAVGFGQIRESGFGKAGADRLLLLDQPCFDHYDPEAELAAMLALDGDWSVAHWLFPETACGHDRGCRLAAELNSRPATQVWRVRDGIAVSRAASETCDIDRPIAAVMMLAEACAEPVSETRHEALPITLKWQPPQSHVIDHGPQPVDPQAVALAEAEFIVSGGNGIHDWALFHKTAKALGAAEGASRVAVDNGFMPRERQVGATGTWVTARVYLAMGISGAIQHLQGIEQCNKVIAVNTDIGCDMIGRGALSVIADSSEVMAELIKLVEAHQQEVSDVAA